LKRVTTWSFQALVNDGFYLALQAFKTMNKNNALILSRRKVTSKSSKNAHPMPETELLCRNDLEVSAYDLFRFFSKEYVEKHRLDEANTISLTY
jgi:hypothetical protein